MWKSTLTSHAMGYSLIATIAVISLSELDYPHFNTANRHAYKIGLDLLLERVYTDGAFQLEGNFTRTDHDNDRVILASLEIKFNTVPPPIPESWPRLPKEFPVDTGQIQGIRLRIAKIGSLGDGWQRLDILLTLDVFAAKFRAWPRFSEPLKIKVSDGFEFIMKYDPNPNYRGPSAIWTEIRLLEKLIDLIGRYGAISMNFFWFDSTTRVLGNGYIHLLNGQTPSIDDSSTISSE